jgi:hypothetical protein
MAVLANIALAATGSLMFDYTLCRSSLVATA